jgi:hypothetical protein
MREIIEKMRVDALDLAVGESITIPCYFCKVTHEHKLCLTRVEDGILYICPRASCGSSGFIPISGYTFTSKRSPRAKQFKPSPFKESTCNPHGWLYYYFQQRYELEKYDLMVNGVKYAQQSSRVVFPTKTKEGETWGCVVKDEFDRTSDRPKAVVYPTIDRVKLHYPASVQFDGTIAIVEDCISATKVAKIMPSVALLGHHLSDEMALDIAKVAKNVVFMLDPDVAHKAIEYAKEYRTLFNTHILFLDRDPKDCDLADLRSWLKEALGGVGG